MKIKLNERVESAHKWLDENGKVQHGLLAYDAGDVVDSAELDVGDPERALAKLVKLGLAAEL